MNETRPAMLTFLGDPQYLASAKANRSISAALVRPDLVHDLEQTHIFPIACDDPTHAYYTLCNYVGQKARLRVASDIDPSARIHPRAFVCEFNVQIGKNVIIEPNASILENVTIEEDCIVRAGAVLGSEGFEHKRTSKGVLSVAHFGSVVLRRQVEIGANCCIDKSVLPGTATEIGEETKLDNLVHVAHNVRIGKRCFLPAAAMIAGSTVIGDDVWIGPGASVSNQIIIGDNAVVSIGSVVTRNVPAGVRVTGNLAIEHQRFMSFMKSLTVK